MYIIYVYMYTVYRYICIYGYMYIYICVCVCVYIYIYTFIILVKKKRERVETSGGWQSWESGSCDIKILHNSLEEVFYHVLSSSGFLIAQVRSLKHCWSSAMARFQLQVFTVEQLVFQKNKLEIMCSIAGSDFSWRNLEMCMVQCWYLNPIFQDPKEENCSATTQNLLVSRVSQLPEQAITNTLQGRKGTADAMDLGRSEGRHHQAKCGVKQQHAGIYPAKKTLDLYTRIRFGGSQWVLATDLHKTGLSNTQNGFNQQNLGLCQQQNQWFHRFTICQQVLIHPNCVVDNVLSQSTNGSL